ncbi:uncharacterized protein LOC143613706 [Bidens hawaiensis]|uniref:uncharacterized protein LOC143613706 n=1 Tax=Bidens hawaiensis TaxID=980011 RepID=UPI00404B167D
MSSNDEQVPQNIPMMLIQYFQHLISNDVEELAMQLFELDAQDAADSQEGSSSRRKGKRKYINRGRKDGDARLWNDYFAPEPVFNESFFRRRFRMSIRLFNHIVKEISKPGSCQHFKYFTQRYNAVGVKGLSPIQKCTSAIRQLAYGASADQCDEYIRIGESTSIECLHKFCRSIVEVFGPRYLRRPNQDDIQRLLKLHSEKHGFVGMLGSIDCMHWAWRNRPTCSNNDINVLNQSPVFNQLLEGNAPQCNFIVNGNEYTQGYYLADGIYPEWSTLVKSFVYPPNNNLKMQYFKRRQESCRKDVERAFGVLQSRWAIIRGPEKSTSIPVLGDIMHACIILHNMIVEDEGHMITDCSRKEHEPEPPSYNGGAPTEFAHYLQRFRSLRSKDTHIALRNDLMEHLWNLKQANEE